MPRRKAELLILECISETKEKRSEGWLLWELMRILGYKKRTNLSKIGGRSRLLEELKKSKGTVYPHIRSWRTPPSTGNLPEGYAKRESLL